MIVNMLLQLSIYLLLLLALVKPLGWYMAQTLSGSPVGPSRLIKPLEQRIYQLAGVDPIQEMSWQQYAYALILFNVLGAISVYLLQRWQFWLPFNPQHLQGVRPDTALNTAISFTTNTNWQSYSGETTMSYATQMLALTVQNFMSAATGISVAITLTRSFSQHNQQQVGNFWVDLTRATLYILLPLAMCFAIILVSQGVIENFNPYQSARLLEPTQYVQTPVTTDLIKNNTAVSLKRHITVPSLILPMGPVASQEAIKLLGTNGGGFFNTNSAHPFENPTPFCNFLQMLAILLIPTSLCYTFGVLVGDTRQGWALLFAMTIIFLITVITILYAEHQSNPKLHALGTTQAASALQPGGNMEGKELRFGINGSALFSAVTAAASCGAVNTMHDSLMPLGGLVPLWLIQLGEVIFGGAGSGLYTILLFAMIAVFIAGLMIGRTPEYLGKKIEAFDIKMLSIAVLITPLLTLIGTMIALMTAAGRIGIFNPGPHGFTEVLYAFSSVSHNNGSAFGGLSSNTPFYNIALSICMWLGRFWIIVPVLAIAGSLAKKRRLAVTSGSLLTHSPLFILLLATIILLFGALTYVPAAALGPFIEHLLLFTS